MRKLSFKFLRSWLPLAVVIVAMSGLVYLTLQQVLRQGANDPQIQLSEDLAASLTSGKSPSAEFPAQQVEISTSLAPFVMIFDDDGKLLRSNALLDGNPPQYPAGVFEYVRQHGQDRVTWQPREGSAPGDCGHPLQRTGRFRFCGGRALVKGGGGAVHVLPPDLRRCLHSYLGRHGSRDSFSFILNERNKPQKKARGK